VTLIVQEIIDDPDWSEGALAFAVDKLPDSMTELKVYSNEGAESANGPIQPPTLRLEYTVDPSTQQ
jgi:hypothetical protein